jgi:predicted transposase YdaD
MASFDTASKKQVETNPQDFVNLCFKFGLKNTTVLEVVTPEQPTVEMHQADILIKALYDGREVLVHFEFQTTDSYDPEMPLRMAGYIIRAIEVYRLPVYSNVIYLRPDAGGNDPGKFEQNLENHNISIEYQVFRLIEIDGQTVLNLKPVGLIPFTPLMKRPAGIDAEQWLRRCIQIADSIDVPNKPEYLGSLAVLGNIVYDPQTILEIISEETMQQSSIAEYLAPEAHEQGLQQGAQETIRENILETLVFRLQPEVAQTFKPALESIDDLQRLKQLFRAAMQVETAEDFKQALNENDN